ncbi:TPA: hypothetical protein P2Q98_004564 [Aeromonas veronii]|uniref:hypothetical protein n=1 Tax=Aeromonas veronii TaxID=654 RepID=UPI00330F0DA5|nr:hypothetical protein [Aeromonas veronii]HDO1336289.1 hypothetical protein [Aeromonas veronii]HDO1340822.1 hypothetical protein [Aeromonas veronii]HDO1345337.1 hypothetical protein [Aeromonas veronii]HDO1349912.1 hypothetical protein [Aeromonas veronii]
MKKAMIAIALLGSMGLVGTASAALLETSQVFTWSGNVPAAPKVDGWVIAQPDGSAIPRGILVFTTDAAGKGVLTGSTELRFQVFEEDANDAGKPDLGKVATKYNYTLTSLAVNSAGLAAEQADAGYFAIQSLNGGVATELKKNTPVAALKEETILSVVKNTQFAAPANQPNAGDSVDVQATVVVDGASLI